MIEQVNAILDFFLSREFILEEDIAWMALTQAQMDQMPGSHFICPIRSVDCVAYRGVEFRMSPWARENHAIHPVWNVTKRTKTWIAEKKKQNT